MKIDLFLLFLFLFSPFSLTIAQEVQPPTIEQTNPFLYVEETEHASFDDDKNEFQAKFFKMLTILGLLIGFMIIAAFALKRMTKSRLTQMNTNSDIQILESRALSSRTTLHILQVEGQKIVIAESATTVSLLHTF